MEAIKTYAFFDHLKAIKCHLPNLKLPRSISPEDDRYLDGGSLFRDLNDGAVKVSRITNLGDMSLLRDEGIVQSGAETRGIIYLKIFRLRTTPREKMDAKALGRDEESIYKAMFDNLVLVSVKYCVSNSPIYLSILETEPIVTLSGSFGLLMVFEGELV